jgi:hypothetical protein
MFYVIADAERVRAPAHARRGRRQSAITEMIKAGRPRAAAGRPSRAAGFAGITIGQLSGPAHDPANARGTS